MRAMSRVERFLERLVERPSARLFRTRLQPVQVLRRIERVMEAGRIAEGGRVVIPDSVRVRLNPDDLARLEPLDATAGELASGALRFARAHGYSLRGRPTVVLASAPGLAPGEIEVEVETSAPIEPAVGSIGPDTGTRVYEVPIVRAPAIVVEIREPGRAPRRVPVSGAPVRIGRAPECEIVLKDSRVSRRHVKLQARDGVLVLTDLGSTNGTRVNGNRVTELVLGAGDQIQVGDTSMTVEAVTAEADARA